MRANNNILVGKKSQIKLNDLVHQILLMFLIITGNIVVFLYKKGFCRSVVQFLFRLLFKCDYILQNKTEMDNQISDIVVFSTPINPANKNLRRNFVENNISPIVDKSDNFWGDTNITGLSL